MNMKRLIAIALITLMLIGCAGMGMTALAETVVRATASVNVRSGPGLDYAELGSVSAGTELTYLNETKYDSRPVAWYKVSYKGKTGWISSVYSKLTSSSGGGSSTTYVRATGNVNVRTGPGLGYEKYSAMQKGETCLYLGSSKYDSRGVLWYMIQYYSYGTYWVSSEYSELVSGDSAGIPDSDKGGAVSGSYVKATGGNTVLRSGPSLDYKELETIFKGDTATYLDNYATDERGRLWYYVSYDGTKGWVSSRYCTLY